MAEALWTSRDVGRMGRHLGLVWWRFGAETVWFGDSGQKEKQHGR